METAVCVSGFLLLVFITGAQLSPDIRFVLVLGETSAEFHANFLFYNLMKESLLYRLSRDKKILLIRCSEPDTPLQDDYSVDCEKMHDDKKYVFRMHDLTLSHSGDYRAEGLISKGIFKDELEHENFRLIVCPDVDEDDSSHEYDVKYGDSVVLCDTKPEYGSSVQLFRLSDEEPIEMVLDTKSLLEPQAADLRGRLQVDLSTSQVTLSGVTAKDFQSLFACVTLKRDQCQSVYGIALHAADMNVFAHEGEGVTLPCISREGEVDWSTPNERVSLDDDIYEEEVMYMLDGSQTGNYSLIIPSVSQQHSGSYRCELQKNEITISRISLYVCSKVSISDLLFSHGKSVLLDITEQVNTSWVSYGFQWHRQKDLEPQVRLVDSDDAEVSTPDDLSGRVTVSLSDSNFSLIIFNLTSEDSGLYTWRVYGQVDRETWVCSEGSIRLVYRDPFGVDSPFYRVYTSLMGCGLLGLVAAVIWFKLRSRRGEQTSGRQSREGQQSGDG